MMCHTPECKIDLLFIYVKYDIKRYQYITLTTMESYKRQLHDLYYQQLDIFDKYQEKVDKEACEEMAKYKEEKEVQNKKMALLEQEINSLKMRNNELMNIIIELNQRLFLSVNTHTPLGNCDKGGVEQVKQVVESNIEQEKTIEEEVVEQHVETNIEQEETIKEEVIEQHVETNVEQEETIVEEVLEEEEEEVVEQEENIVEEVVEEEEEEVVEEEEQEELYGVIIKGKTYYTTNETDGIIYQLDENEEPTIEVGKYKNGKAKFYK